MYRVDISVGYTGEMPWATQFVICDLSFKEAFKAAYAITECVRVWPVLAVLAACAGNLLAYNAADTLPHRTCLH